MLRKKHSEPAQPDGQQALLEFETPADQPGKKDPKQFFKKNWKKITAVVCAAAVAAAVLLPSTGDLLWGLVDGSIGSTLWESVTGSTDKLASYLLKLGANNTTGTLSTVLHYFASGASYVCYVNGQQVIYQTSTKYPVLAGGVAIGKSTSGTVKSMRQLLPAVIDKVGAASVMSGGEKYETADDMQVYLWCKGTYYPTTLSQVNSEDYSLIGWYDANGSAARGKIRVLIAVKKD